MRPGKKWLLVFAAAFVFGGLAGSALSLLNYEPSFCTTFERGWPLAVVVYPCPCDERGSGDWYVWVPGLIADTILFGTPALLLVGMGKFLSSAPAGRD